MYTKTYGYTDSTWKDLATNIHGTAITYDDIGNPLNWTNSKTLTWQNGRQLKSVVKSGEYAVGYTYDGDGLRLSKWGSRSTKYIVLDGTYLGERTTIDGTEYLIVYIYGADGSVMGLEVNGTAYYFVKNLQGDVTAIIDAEGNVYANYSYDAYGYIMGITDASGNQITSDTHIANLNPFRYRGYFYDQETGFYYLTSRYYDPEYCRFLNADGLVSTGQGFDGYNMFAYCGNNPVTRVDTSGRFWGIVIAIAAAVVAVIGIDHYLAENHPEGVALIKDPNPENNFDERAFYAKGGGPSAENGDLTLVDLEVGVYDGTSTFEDGNLSFTKFLTGEATVAADISVEPSVDIGAHFSVYTMSGEYSFDVFDYRCTIGGEYHLGYAGWDLEADIHNLNFKLSPPTTGIGYGISFDLDPIDE